MAKRKRKQRRKPKAQKRESEAAKLAGMRMLIREAAKTGATEAIEHCANFWSVSDGYKKYIDYQIKTQAEVLMAAVKTALREELQRRDNLARRDAIDRGYKRARRKPKP